VSSEQAKTWNRPDTDKILAFATALAAVAAVVVAIQTEMRVRKTEWREVEAAAIAVGGKVRLIAHGAEHSAQFMQAYIDHKSSNPKDLDQIDAYIIELAHSPEFPELTVTPEQLAVLARADSEAASMLAACSNRLGDIQIDSKQFADAKPSRLTHIQLLTAQVMPYRLRELGEACNASLNALVALVPQLPKIMGPIRGTLGELIESNKSSIRDRERGTHVELHLGARDLKKDKQTISGVARKKTSVVENSKEE
jgi:hypothetical protein